MYRATFGRVLNAAHRVARWSGFRANNPVLDPLKAERARLSHRFLKGNGIEVGALHDPLQTGPQAQVRYVDRMSVEDLRRHYPELADKPLVKIDVIDNGEELSSIAPESLDFVIANHFIEHCQNPIRTLLNFMRVLKIGGVLYMAVPDKRLSFDIDRPLTTLEHLVHDFEKGPETSRNAHFEEWVAKVDKIDPEVNPSGAKARLEQLLALDYSIHFHVWTPESFEAFLREAMTRYFPETKLLEKRANGPEFIVVLRKNS